MAKKVGRRFFGEWGQLSYSSNLAWMKANTSSFEELAVGLDRSLWLESELVSHRLEIHAGMVLARIDYDLGGGGVYPFLYFITRYLQPKCVVETGVAAGYSSSAFLAALKANATGRLYSSDFPYFRLPKPEQFIGVVVEETLRDRWKLLIEGDEVNLPKILSQIDEVDIFHYDSDKSHRGRKFAISLIAPRMATGGIILMDDIQDNSFFHDYVVENSVAHWRVFEFKGKYVGMIGDLKQSKAFLTANGGE